MERHDLVNGTQVQSFEAHWGDVFEVFIQIIVHFMFGRTFTGNNIFLIFKLIWKLRTEDIRTGPSSANTDDLTSNTIPCTGSPSPFSSAEVPIWVSHNLLN